MTIALVLGIILVVTCFIVSFVYFRKQDRRMRSTRSREPELLSYSSTVDSYREGIIWDFENRRNVRDFLSKVINKNLPTSGIISSMRRSMRRGSQKRAGASNSVTSSKRKMKAKGSEVSDEAKSSSRSCDGLYSGSSTSAPETRSSHSTAGDVLSPYDNSDDFAMPYCIYDDTLHDATSSDRISKIGKEGHSGIRPRASGVVHDLSSRETLRSDQTYEEISDVLSRTHINPGAVNELDFGESSFGDSSANGTYYCSSTIDGESSISSQTVNTISSSAVDRARRENGLDGFPGVHHVISLSQLSINIRSCPDSPLCGSTGSPEGFTDTPQRQNISTSDGNRSTDESLSGIKRNSSLSTTILDIIQGEARKRGLVKDSLVHDH